MKHFFLIVMLVLVTLPLFALREATFDFFIPSFSARTAAIGGIHSALADDFTVLLSNPAGIRSITNPIFSLGEATVSAYGPVPQIASQIALGTDTSSAERQYGIINLKGPLSLGYVGNGMGLGIFNTTNVKLWTWSPDNPGTGVKLEQNFVFVGGLSFRIPLPERWNSTLDFGASLIPFLTFRGQASALEETKEFLLSLVNPFGAIKEFPFSIIRGVEVDFGVLYSYRDVFSIGFSGRNFAMTGYNEYTSYQSFRDGESPIITTDNLLPLDISGGLYFRPRLNAVSLDLKMMLDYDNIFDFLIYPGGATNPLLHIGAGLEFKMLEILYLRAGFFQCLPSAGIGLDLSLFTLNASFFGRELSKDVWGYPVYSYSIGVEAKY